MPTDSCRRGAATPPPISAIVLTKNSERKLDAVLHALLWCNEVIVFDTGSDDRTLAIAAQFANVRIHTLDGPFPGFGLARRHAVALAAHHWILSVDSDEIVSPALAAEIRSLPLDPGCVYSIPFHNYYNGRRITTCGWSPDRHERLFHRGMANFSVSGVHERVNCNGGAVIPLRHPIEHFSYEAPEDFLRKMAEYSRLFAQQHAGRRSATMGTAVARSAWAFLKSYVIERGALQGSEGLVISAYKAQTVFWKYVMLQRANGAA